MTVHHMVLKNPAKEKNRHCITIFLDCAVLEEIISDEISIGNSMICSDIWHIYHEWYFEIYYYPQKVCSFHTKVFQIKLKYHCSKSLKLQKFLM